MRPPGDGMANPDLSLHTLRAERYVVALPEGHALAARRRIRMADLRGEDLIVHSGHGRSAMHDAVLALCRDAGFEPVIRHEVAETSTLVTFVAAALGVAIVPEPVAELMVAGATYRPLVSRARMDLVAATRSADESALVARALVVLRGHVGD
ncbi:LysR family substrate-binding domain-containing protein [Janibacter sp. G1551]|uniref:LysR family substrate-binding domain-containing protein n=1 Tax=Janibacter sp. G1551 TaxID=3420440 RepID=UPI003CFC3ACB